jgi:hypothetical protein
MANTNGQGNNSFDALHAKREEALETVMAYWEGHRNSNLTEKDYEDFNKALDVLTITHAMMTFEFASGSMVASFRPRSEESDERIRDKPRQGATATELVPNGDMRRSNAHHIDQQRRRESNLHHR